MAIGCLFQPTLRLGLGVREGLTCRSSLAVSLASEARVAASLISPSVAVAVSSLDSSFSMY